PRRVAVMVEPGIADLTAAQRAGFDAFQIHFKHTVPRAQVMEWNEFIGRDRLWLAPKLPPGTDVSPMLLPLADTFLLDTFHETGFGGSGQTGDWEKFARHQAAFPEKTWILAGGLNPRNITDAIARSGARFVDVNSGVEDSPGIKDPALLRALQGLLT
ncbi:phosphoribosylanthranilate isomerase, partial [Geminisphaera colitermitum]|uniref:phosphoribosylanthranilate isomerase n=1 Tax=Geminisphaera colitermitum TaxID=1148786 RepID=UPI0005B7D9AB